MKVENINRAIELQRQIDLLETWEESFLYDLQCSLNVNLVSITQLHLIGKKHSDKTVIAEKYKTEIAELYDKYFSDKKEKFIKRYEIEKQKILKEIETL